MNRKYMFDNEWSDEHERLYDEVHLDSVPPKVKIVENGIILPAKDPTSNPYFWGTGGVLDNDLNYVEESGINGLFGGAYPFDRQSVSQEEMDIVYIGVLPHHWGHFLRDIVCRLWYVARNLNDNYKIAFGGWNWSEDRITGNYLQFFELLGIKEERLLFVSAPIAAKKIIIPERTLGLDIAKREYMEAIDIVVRNALAESQIKERFDKIYFTRTQFLKSKLNEVGEKEIEECFHNAGLKLWRPKN